MMVLKKMTGIKFSLRLQYEKGANTFDFCLIACIWISHPNPCMIQLKEEKGESVCVHIMLIASSLADFSASLSFEASNN